MQPPSVAAARLRSLAPGKFLRVAATAMSGLPLRAALTMSCALVAMPHMYSSTFWAIFQALCRSSALPVQERRQGFPSAASPSSMRDSTVRPQRERMRAAGSVPETVHFSARG